MTGAQPEWGSPADLTALVLAWDAWVSAEALARKFDAVPAMQLQADERHQVLVRIAMTPGTGFDPTARHAPLIREWAERKVMQAEQTMPLHVAEVRGKLRSQRRAA